MSRIADDDRTFVTPSWDADRAAPTAGIPSFTNEPAPGWFLSNYLWLAWWTLLGILAILSVIAFISQRNQVGGVLLLGSLYGAAQTLGWFLTSWMEERTLATLRQTRLGEPAPSTERWSTGARWWRRWHWLGTVGSVALIAATVNNPQQKGWAIALAVFSFIQMGMFVMFLIWLGMRSRLRAVAQAAQVLDFTYWPTPTPKTFPELEYWPTLAGKYNFFVHGLRGQIGPWQVAVVEAYLSKADGAMGRKNSTLVMVSPTLNIDFLLTPRDDRDKINWAGMIFHLLHVAGWLFIAIELGTKLFKKKEVTRDFRDVPHGDAVFAQRYQLLGLEHEILLRLFHGGVRQELLPKQWMQAPWHLEQKETQTLIARPGERSEPKKLPEFMAECLKLIALLQEAEREVLADWTSAGTSTDLSTDSSHIEPPCRQPRAG